VRRALRIAVHERPLSVTDGADYPRHAEVREIHHCVLSLKLDHLPRLGTNMTMTETTQKKEGVHVLSAALAPWGSAISSPVGRRLPVPTSRRIARLSWRRAPQTARYCNHPTLSRRSSPCYCGRRAGNGAGPVITAVARSPHRTSGLPTRR
jgi:hypothetical protein